MVDATRERKSRQAVMEGLSKCEHFFFGGIGEEGMHLIAHSDAEAMAMITYRMLKENPAAWRSMRAQDEDKRLSGCASWRDSDEVGFQLSELPEDYQERFKSWIIEALQESDPEQWGEGEKEDWADEDEEED